MMCLCIFDCPSQFPTIVTNAGCILQDKMGFKEIGALDIRVQCSGFVYGLSIAEQYIYPAVDIFRSGTRREELLLPPHQWEKISIIRRGLAGHRPIEAIERMLSIMEKFPSNAQMLLDIKPMY